MAQIFCRECGVKISETATTCPKCGAKQKVSSSGSKSKTTAILLAVFLGFWTWLYTYKKNSTKFWIALGCNVLLFWTIIVPFGFWIWAMIDVATKDKSYYDDF